MGWLGDHLHAFDIDGTWYGPPDPDWGSDDLDEGECRLGDVLSGEKMRWDYDFGDGWEHNVLVEKITPADPEVEYPVCLAGRGACPPEDCGGPYGYDRLLALLGDSSHPDHEELKAWVPPDFDPAYFDVEEANLAVRSPRPLGGW
jgi:hypothetical protein